LFRERFRPCAGVDKIIELPVRVRPVARQGILH
jgi:hypothetical protein